MQEMSVSKAGQLLSVGHMRLKLSQFILGFHDLLEFIYNGEAK
jgi:hypothetical protein